MWADPQLVRDPKGAADVLAPLLGRPAVDLQRQLVSDSRFEYLQRKVDDAVADQVDGMKLPASSPSPEPTRFRPSGDLASSVVGDTDTETMGISGVEKQFDDLLTGFPGRSCRSAAGMGTPSRPVTTASSRRSPGRRDAHPRPQPAARASRWR